MLLTCTADQNKRMPLKMKRWKPRFDVFFLSVIGCLVLTCSMLNLKSQPQASHSFVKIEKPSIGYGPYRSGENKRILGRETYPSRDEKHSSALDESKVVKSLVAKGVPELRKAEHAPIVNDTTPLQVKNETDSIKQQTFLKGGDTSSSRANHTDKIDERVTITHVNASSGILNDDNRSSHTSTKQAVVNDVPVIVNGTKRSIENTTSVNEQLQSHPKDVLNIGIESSENMTDANNRMQKKTAILAKDSEPTKGSHRPTYFHHEVPLEKLISRGNLLRVYTGCSIATWSFSGWTEEEESRFNDCYLDKGYGALMMHQVTKETASQVLPFDSIYVPIASLERFVANVLPMIENNFILMTGQKSLVPPFSRELFDTIIEHPRVIKWFLQNQAVYSYNNKHPKMGVFPYGIYTKYPEEYLAEMRRKVHKDNFIYVGYLNKGTNKNVRKDIPRQRHKIPPPLYFSGLRNSTYVLSPDGDRPECHRHYEAIGLGTVPITGLDPNNHSHLVGNAIFGEQRWKLDELEEKLPRNPKVNQRLVFEEYWMEYFEREMVRPLRWWDPSRNVRCSLEEITNIVKNS
jgi:hypothetical protein